MEQIQHFISGHGIIFQILLFALLFAYGYNIAINLFRLLQIWKGIIRLKGFINAYNQSHKLKWKRKLLLNYFPIISRYLGIHSHTLSYDNDNFTLYYKAVPMYNIMQSERDKQIHRFKASFSPVLGFKTFVTFPVVILSWFGMRPRNHLSFLIGTIGWIIAYLLGMFEAEIKELIIILFKKFI